MILAATSRQHFSPPHGNSEQEETNPTISDQSIMPAEISERKQRFGRRYFSVEEKLQILKHADACSQTGELQAFLDSKGIYHSLLSNWRKQLKVGMHEALAPKKRGRPPKTQEIGYLVKKIAELEKQKRDLEHRVDELMLLVNKRMGKP